MKRRKPLNLEGLCSMRIDDEESPDLEIVRPDRNNYSTTSSPSSRVVACPPDEDGPPDVSTLKDFQLDEKIETYHKLDHSMRMPDGNRKLKLYLQEFEDEKKRRRSQKQTGIQVQVEDTNVSSRPDLVKGIQLSLDSEVTASGVRLSSSSQQQSRPVGDKDCCMVAFELSTDKVILRSSPPAHGNGNEVSHIHDLEQSPSSRNCKVCPLCQKKFPASKRPIQANGEDDQILCTKCRGIPISSPTTDTTPVDCKPQREQHCDSPRLISGRSLDVMKRSHQAIGDTPDTALELSDDEENPKGVDAQPSSRGDLPNRKKLRSALKKRRAGAKVLYPSSHDPEAVEVRYADLEHLAPSEFLNDTVIDFYIKYIQINYFSEQEEKLQRFHFFTCFFYKKLTSGKKAKGNDCFEKLHKWTKGINIFEKSYLLMPIHDSSHWSLAIICFPRGQKVPYILHLDSIPRAGHSSEDIYKMLKSYLEVERRRLLQENHDAEDITEVEPSKAICRRVTVPLQKNDWDCGLFMLYYIELFVQQVPPYCDSTHLDKMFGQKWFKPKEASELRGVILQLLDSIFDQRYRCIATTLESVCCLNMTVRELMW